MTIKELCKKVNTYNEIADIIHGEHIALSVSVKFSTIHYCGINRDYKAFVKYLKSELVDEAAAAILNFDGYELNEDAEIKSTLADGYENTDVVTLYA